MIRGSNIGSNLVNGAFAQYAASGGQILFIIFGQIWLEIFGQLKFKIFGKIWLEIVEQIWLEIFQKSFDTG